MKQLFTVLCLILAGVGFAQQVSYQVLEDDASKAYSKFVAPEFGTEYNSANFSGYLGANARLGLIDLFDIEGIARLDVFQMSGKGPGFLLEGGVFLPLSSTEKRKEVPVVLSYNPSAGSTTVNGTSYRIEESKYIKIPDGQYLNKMGVRGGFHTRSMGVESDGIKAPAAESHLTLFGIYLGGQYTSQAYVKAKINNDVERFGAGFVRYYGDLIIFPVSDLADPAVAPAISKDKTIGWRAGFQWYLDPHEGEYKRLMNSIFTAELGSRPYSGFFFNFSWGFAFMNGR